MTAQDIITGLHQAIDAERKRTVADGMTVQGEELLQFVERYERLESEKKDVADAQKEVMAEAGGRGYDVKVLRKIIAMRKRDADDLAEENAILEIYTAALGMN